LIIAVIAAGTILLLDVFFFQPYVDSQRDVALREQAFKAHQAMQWALEAEQARLAGICESFSGGREAADCLAGKTFSPALAERVSALGNIDAAWLCSLPDRQSGRGGRVEAAWQDESAEVSAETIDQVLADLGASDDLSDGRRRDGGLVVLGDRVAVFAACDVGASEAAAPAAGRLYLTRFLDADLLAELGRAVPGRLRLLTLADLADSDEAGGFKPGLFRLRGRNGLSVAWPIHNVAGFVLGYIETDISVAEIHNQAAVIRRTVLIVLWLSGTAMILVILGADILLANPINRLLNRVHGVENGNCPTDEEFTRHLHAEPLALARKIQRAFASIARLSKTDALTALANRRHFEQLLEHAFAEARRYQRPLSVLVMDIDLFKAINDTGGHKAGDDLLRIVAEIVRDCCRKSDVPARLGGDEFIILLPETGAAGAAVMAERIRKSVFARTVSLNDAEINVTVSLGVADCNAGRIETPHDLVVLADRALYAAKQHGRNRVFQAHDLESAQAVDGDREGVRVGKLRGKLAGLDTQFKALFVRALQEILQALERRDPHKADHARKVRRYAVLIARRMNLTEQETKRIELAALLHDIGMLALPDSVALWNGPLNEQQIEAIQRHPLLGARILEGMEFLEQMIPAVRSHHERFDGGGYPDGQVGQAIPLAARIIAVADVFDAMTSPRSFRAARPVEEALAELRNIAGTQLDPAAVAAFLDEADRLAEIPLPTVETDEAPADPPAEHAEVPGA